MFGLYYSSQAIPAHFLHKSLTTKTYRLGNKYLVPHHGSKLSLASLFRPLFRAREEASFNYITATTQGTSNLVFTKVKHVSISSTAGLLGDKLLQDKPAELFQGNLLGTGEEKKRGAALSFKP